PHHLGRAVAGEIHDVEEERLGRRDGEREVISRADRRIERERAFDALALEHDPIERELDRARLGDSSARVVVVLAAPASCEDRDQTQRCCHPHDAIMMAHPGVTRRRSRVPPTALRRCLSTPRMRRRTTSTPFPRGANSATIDGMRHQLRNLGCALLVVAAVGCSDDGVSDEEGARIAYLGIDPAVDKMLDLGFKGRSEASSAHIPEQSTTGDVSGTMTVGGKVDAGNTKNDEMDLTVVLVGYSDGAVASYG